MKAKNGNNLEKPGGRYCNMKNSECREYNKIDSGNGGYICLYCGGRVSKWLPFSQALDSFYRNKDNESL